MLMLTEDRNRQSDDRLRMKTQNDTLMRAAMDGAGLTRWEARALPELVEEIYFSHVGEGPLRDGQQLFQCTAIDEGAGKPLKSCRQVQVRLTTHDLAIDRPLHREQGGAAMRQQVLCRITEEARSQGGLLTQEDAAFLLHTSVRTIRRDMADLLERDIHIATRGVLKDIGPSVSHKGIAIRHWLAGKEPADVARAINHSVQAVDRYLADFCRVVFATRQGFDTTTTCRMTRLSATLVTTYRDIYDAAADNQAHAYRWQEIELQLGTEDHQLAEKSAKKGAIQIPAPCDTVSPTKTQEVVG